MNEKKYPVVSSPRDPRFLNLRSLQTHQGRSRTRLFIIEGIRHLARAVEHCAPIESVFLNTSVLSNPFGQKLARRLHQHGVPGISLSRELYRDLTLATEPQGIGAVLKQRWFLWNNSARREIHFGSQLNRSSRLATWAQSFGPLRPLARAGSSSSVRTAIRTIQQQFAPQWGRSSRKS